MGCQIRRNKKGEISQIYAPNGKSSILFKDISTLGFTTNQTVRLWAHTYTGSFKEEYKGNLDENGEAIFHQADEILSGFIDEVYYTNDIGSKVRKISEKYNMNSQGFIPSIINLVELNKELRANLLDYIKVKKAKSGSYYLSAFGKFYNPFNPSYQLNSSGTPTNEKLNNIVEIFLDKIQAKVEYVGQLEYDAVARVNTLNKIIEVVEHKQGIDTLTEEAVHLMISMVRGSTTYENMMKSIENYEVYDEVLLDYENVENYDERKVREEAVVKFVTSLVVQDSTVAKSWWNIIIDYLRNLFNQDAISDFRKASKKIIDADTTNLSPVIESDIFYQIDPNPDKKQHILDEKKKTADLNLVNRDGRYYIPHLKKHVRFRPSDKVADYARYLYGKREYTPELKDFYTTKGTIVHKYNQIIMENILSDVKNISQSTTEGIVYTSLKNSKEFEKFQDRAYYSLTKEQWNNLEKGVRHLYDSIIEKDKNAEIFTEEIVYNPKNQVDDIAGTIDLMVIYSDGTIGIYDYKSMRFQWSGDTRSYVDPSDEKRQIFDLQLSQYKQILKESWGLTDNDFRETRIIPINSQFTFKGDKTKEGFYKLEMFHPGLSKNYLKELSVAKEFVTDDVDLNTFLKRIYNKRSELRNGIKTLSGDKRKEAKLRISKLNATINDIIVVGEVINALDDIGEIVTTIENSINNFTPKDVMEYKDLIKLYESFNVSFIKSIETLPEEKREEVKERVRYYNDLIDVAKSLLETRHIDLVQNFSDRDMLDGGKVKEGLGAIFDGIAQWDNPIIFTIGKILAEQKEKVLRGTGEIQGRLDAEIEIDKVHDKYMIWAKSKDLSGTAVFDPLIRNSTGNLITRFVKKFYEDRDKAISEGRRKYYIGEDVSKEFKWFDENYTFNEERWKEDYEKLEDMFRSNSTYSQIDKDNELKKMIALNPKHNKTAWFVFSNHYVRPKDDKSFTTKKYISKEWSDLSLPENAPAKAYIAMYHKYNKEIQKMVGYDKVKSNFVAHIHANTAEKMGTLGVFKQFTLFSDMKRSMEIIGQDETMGVTDANDIDGNPINRIPIIHTTPLKGDVNDSDKFKIEEEVSKEYERGSVDFLNAVDARIKKLQYERGIKNKSRELTKSLKLMYKSALDYRFKSEVEDAILLMRETLTLDRYEEIPTDKFNNPIMDKLTNTFNKRMGASNTTIEVADKFIKLLLYGRKIQSKDKLIKYKGRTYSGIKMVQAAQQFLSVKSLGFNAILAGASNAGAQINRIIVGKKGTYFTNQGFKEALKTIVSSDEKTATAIWFFEPSARDLSYDNALKKSASRGVRLFNMRNIFGLHRGLINKRGSKDIDNPIFGDDNVDNTILISMLKSWVIDDDGKIRSLGDPLRPPKNSNAPTLYDSFDHKEMKVKGLGSEEFTRFRRLVSEAQNAVKGSMTEDQNNMANTHIEGMMAMKFRNWMPGLIKQKLAKFRYDPLLESWKEGHFRTTGQEVFSSLASLSSEQEMNATGIATIFGGLIMPVVGNIISLGGEIISFGVYKHTINRKKAEFFRLKFLSQNPTLKSEDFTLDRYVEFRKKQFRAMATELRFVMMLSTVLLTVMSGLGWDDDEDNFITWNLYKLARRSSLELSFFFDINSVTEILKSPLPVMRLAVDFQAMAENFLIESSELIGLKDVNTKDRTPYGYYTLKQLPGINQILSMSAYFNQSQSKSTFEKIFGESNFFEDSIMSRK